MFYIIGMYENNPMNQVIECFEHFDLEEKEYLIDILTKELREAKRDKIYTRFLEARENRKKGKVKSGNICDLKADLEKD